MLRLDPIEVEVDAIRQEIWREIKDMTWEEREEYFRQGTKEVGKQFNIKVSDMKPMVSVTMPDGAVDVEDSSIYQQIRAETEGMSYDEEEAYFRSNRVKKLLKTPEYHLV